jgi:hypothetical protein
VELSQLRKEVSELRKDTAKNTKTLTTLSKDFLECKNMVKGLTEQKDVIQSVLEAKYKRISAEAIKKQEENNSEIFGLLHQLVEGNKKNHDIFDELAEEKKKTTQLLISMAAMQSTVDSLYDICSCCKQHMYDTLSLVRARPKQMIFKDADTSKALRWMDGEVKGFSPVLDSSGDYYALANARGIACILEKVDCSHLKMMTLGLKHFGEQHPNPFKHKDVQQRGNEVARANVKANMKKVVLVTCFGLLCTIIKRQHNVKKIINLHS